MDYANNSGAQQAWAEELIGRLDLTGDESILDIGCGDGRMTAVLAERVPEGRVLGIDSSAEMIRFAREGFGDREPQLSFEHIDAGAIPFEDQFDLIYSNAALHHVQDHIPVVQGIAGALRKGGRCMLSMGGRGNVAETSAAVRSLIDSPPWAEYFGQEVFTYNFYGPDDYEGWLGDAGLEPLRLELVPKDMVHTREKFTAWIRTTWIRYTHRVPEDRREDFIAAIVDRYLERCAPDADGLVHTLMIRLEVEARKR